MLRDDELIIDNFAGGGGASLGIEWGTGRHIDVAINHDPEAVAMHAANHPHTLHYCQSVWKADPRDVVMEASRRRGSSTPLRVGLAWFSPDCKHFSKAKGAKPVKKNIRDLAWVVVHWGKLVKPRIIMLENVEEFRQWGPLIQQVDAAGNPVFDLQGNPVLIPDATRAGETFHKWVRQLRALGYVVEWRELKACDYGAPTIRKRLFIIARCDGEPIVWPMPTHRPAAVSKDGIVTKWAKDHGLTLDDIRTLRPYRTAAECIDWSIPCPSIFERKKPLVENTMARIGRGVWRYVINSDKPFIIPVTHHGDASVHPIDEPLRTITTAKRGELALVVPTLVGCGGRAGQSRPRGADEPLATITAKADVCLAAATLVQTGYGERSGQAPRALDIEKPLGTVVAGGGKHAVVAAFLAQHNGGPRNESAAGRAASEPVSTITTSGAQQQIVTSHLVKLRGTCKDGQRTDAPMPTITAGGFHVGEVRAFLIKYFSTAIGQDVGEPLHTVTAKPRFGLVTVAGEEYEIVDIGMRMLTPPELFRAQGFPPSYIIDRGPDGKPITITAQVGRCGNSVSPVMPEALIRANSGAQIPHREAA